MPKTLYVSDLDGTLLRKDETLSPFTVETINALSAHADRNGLMDWYRKVGGSVKHAFAIHGEPEKVEAMRELLLEHGAPNATAPVPGQTFVFD